MDSCGMSKKAIGRTKIKRKKTRPSENSAQPRTRQRSWRRSGGGEFYRGNYNELNQVFLSLASSPYVCSTKASPALSRGRLLIFQTSGFVRSPCLRSARRLIEKTQWLLALYLCPRACSLAFVRLLLCPLPSCARKHCLSKRHTKLL